jgi:hypothetical protein
MRVAVLYYPHREGHNSVFPLFAYRQNLADHGIHLDFFTSLDSFLASKAEVAMVSGFSLPKLLYAKKLRIPDFLKQCHSKRVPLIYLSGSDSTGPFDQEVLPWVDLYLARQLVSDRSFYLRPHRRHFFRHKYFAEFNFKNQDQFPLVTYSNEEVEKLGISWNLGLIDWKTQTSSKIIRYAQIFRRNSSFPDWNGGPPLASRTYDVMFRGNLFFGSHDAPRLHRLQTFRIYRQASCMWRGVPEGIVSHNTYMAELSSSRICLSPFGWGEICYRDFEAFQAKALLVKPSMDHLETFPNYYTPDTYLAYQWSAKDLPEKINAVLENPQKYQEIADMGWNHYNSLTKGTLASENFSIHLRNQLNHALKIFLLRSSP